MTSILSNFLFPGAAGEQPAAVGLDTASPAGGGNFAPATSELAPDSDFMNLLLQPQTSKDSALALAAAPNKNFDANSLSKLIAFNMLGNAPQAPSQLTGEGESLTAGTSEISAGGEVPSAATQETTDSTESDEIQELGATEPNPSDIIPAGTISGKAENAQGYASEMPRKGKDIQTALTDTKITDSTPILLVLTGKLERLVPEAIPSLILNNEFIKSSLASNNIDGFLNEPTTLGNILASFGVPASAAHEIGMAVDLNTVVTPSEILKAINVDPQQVSSELQMLKDNLPLDGLRPYVERSEKLAGKSKKTSFDDTDVSSSAGLKGMVSHAPQGTEQPRQNAQSTQPKNEGIKAVNAYAAHPNQNPFTAIDAKTKDGFKDALIDQSTSSKKDADADQPDWLKLTAQNVSDEKSNELGQAMKESMGGQDFSGKGKTLDLERMAFFKTENDDKTGEGSSFEASLTDVPAHRLFEQPNKLQDATPVKQSAAMVDHSQIVSQKVVDNAVMLLNDGGGTIRVDFKTDTLGPVDLAIQVNDNKVDLKIIAANDSVRDMLTSEMPKLREALSAQNITLHKAEVGLSNNPHNSHFSGNAFNSFNNQNFSNNSNEQQNSGKQPSSFSRPGYFKPVAATKVYAPRFHNGSISVLA
ncbi:MAG: flagellar hook-length control protein FliK [Oligoflexales bacterium]